MKKSVRANYVYNMMYQIMAAAVPLITIPYVSRTLGAEGVGDYSYTSAIVSYFGLIAATGTATFAQREIAVRQDDRERRSVLFWEVFLFRLATGAVAAAAYTVFLLGFMPQYRTLYVIHYLTVFSWLADISWYFQGSENFRVTAVKDGAVKIAGAVLIFLFVKDAGDLWVYALIMAAAVFAGNLSMWGCVLREVDWPARGRIRVFRNTKGIMGMFVPVLSVQIFLVLDKTMLGALCDAKEVGYYAQAEKVIMLVLTVISALVPVLMPRIAVLYRKGEMEGVRRYYGKALDFIFMLALPMLAGCILVAGEFVPLFYGEGYEPVTRLMQVESLLFIVTGLGRLFGNFLMAMNRQRRYATALVVSSTLNAALNYVFIGHMRMGAAGAAMATIVSESVCTVLQLYFLKDLQGCRLILRSLARYIPPTCVMSVAVLAVRHRPDGVVSLILSVLLGAFVYGIALLIRRDELVMDAAERMASKMRRFCKRF